MEDGLHLLRQRKGKRRRIETAEQLFHKRSIRLVKGKIMTKPYLIPADDIKENPFEERHYYKIYHHKTQFRKNNFFPEEES